MISTLIIIAITCLVSFAAFSDPNLLRRLILWPPAVERDKQYYRLITYGLIHADGQHLLFNMITLYFFGRAMEDFYALYLGPLGFAIFYVGGLVISILPTFIANRNNSSYRSLGASGGVSAVLFAFILLHPWSKIIVFVVPMPALVYAILYIVYSIYMDQRRSDNVNHSAHLWGAAYGIAFTVVMEPRVISVFLNGLANRGTPAF